MNLPPFQQRLALIVSVVILMLAACAPTTATTPTAVPDAETKSPASTQTAEPVLAPDPATPTSVFDTALPEILSTSTYVIKANRFQLVGSDLGVSVAFNSDTKDVVIINRYAKIRIDGGLNGKTIEVAVVDTDDVTLGAWFAEGTIDDLGESYVASLSLSNLMGGWDYTRLPVEWNYHSFKNMLESRQDFSQTTVVDPRKELGMYSFIQVTCEPYESDPGNLPPGIRFNQPHTYQIVVFAAELDLIKTCGDRGLGGIYSVWANEFGFNENAAATDELAHRQLMSDALSMYLSPVIKNGKVVSENGKVVLLLDSLLQGVTNYARFISGADVRGGLLPVPITWLK